ncbi:hypothetical protein HDU99_006081, partial [Rhizoclosmatium hyalinum]
MPKTTIEAACKTARDWTALEMGKLNKLVNCYLDLTGSEAHHKSPQYLALWHCNYLASKIKSVKRKPK